MHEAQTTIQLPTHLEDDGRAARALLAHLRHELRTPLNAVIGYSELLLEEAEAGEFDDSLRKMLAAGRELLTFVNDLLDPALLEVKMSELSAQSHVASVRHQLRTSLTTVSGYCELLLEEAAEAGRVEVSADLERIHRAAEKFLTLIDSVVDLARLEQGVEAPATQAASVNGISRESVSNLLPFAANTTEVLQSLPGSLLVVDDNEVNRDLLVRRLAREGHQVAVAMDGRQALEMIEAGNYDLVLLDVIMPELNGYQVLDRLKSQGRLRDLPVIMLSSLGEMESVVQCISLGAEDYLSKPYDPVLLRARIGASLEKKRLRDRLREQLRAIEQELDVAARIQQSILPRKFPASERIEVFAEMTPARAIGTRCAMCSSPLVPPRIPGYRSASGNSMSSASSSPRRDRMPCTGPPGQVPETSCELLVAAVEARRDSPHRTLEYRSNLVVRHPLEVPEHDGHAKLRRQVGDGRANGGLKVLALGSALLRSVESCRQRLGIVVERPQPRPPPPVVVAGVDDDAEEPRRELGLEAKLREHREELEKDCLRDVLGRGLVARVVESDRVDPVLVALEELVERGAVAEATRLEDPLVGITVAHVAEAPHISGRTTGLSMFLHRAHRFRE